MELQTTEIIKEERKQTRTEKIEKQGQAILNGTKNCKSMRKVFEVVIAQQYKKGNLELEYLTRGLYEKFKQFYPTEEKTPKVIEITLENWKGEDHPDIYKGFTNDFIIVEHIKDKETKEVTETKKEISHVNVNRLLFIIRKWQIKESHSCYELAEMLGYEWKEVWKQRTKIYFLEYYYPLKVLEKIGIIKYGGRGNITRIK